VAESDRISRYVNVAGGRVPRFIYGTAWKADETERLTRQALEAGFRGIDTANQRRHYYEAGVGLGIARAITDGLVRREDLFLQTKFTYAGGQDHRLPYDPAADLTTQVQQSFASSLDHLKLETLDAYLLHGPSRRVGLGPEDLEVWQAIEDLHAAGHTRMIGVSNVGLAQLEELCAWAATPPACVQNRCFASTGWDAAVRTFCRAHGIVYQGFSLLTANAAELRHPALAALAARFGRTPAQIVFRFAQQAGILPLTGTSDALHMREDLHVYDFELAFEDVRLVERLAQV
jgi:diketogulonate reductase-like aldo/keto reductase